MELVSIIVPVYNSEQYINRCLNSLINQTYKNIEIIIIDDGSTDNSSILINEYIKKDKRIKVFFQENSGPSVARNNGIIKSNGDYIVFCDSDDYVEINYVEKLLENIIKLDCNILACGYIDVSEYGVSKLNDFYNGEDVLTKENFINCILKGVGGTLWGKIFKKDIIITNNIRMNPDIYMCEDMIFLLEYITYCNKCGAIEDKLYNYNRLNENSISSKTNMDYYNILVKSIEEIEKILKKSGFCESYIDNILSQRIKDISIKFLIMQYSLPHRYIKGELYNNIQIILDNKYLQKYKLDFKSNKIEEKIMILLINKNKNALINYYSFILYKLQQFKNRVKGVN